MRHYQIQDHGRGNFPKTKISKISGNFQIAGEIGHEIAHAHVLLVRSRTSLLALAGCSGAKLSMRFVDQTQQRLEDQEVDNIEDLKVLVGAPARRGRGRECEQDPRPAFLLSHTSTQLGSSIVFPTDCAAGK